MFDIKTLLKPMIPMIKGHINDEKAKQIFDAVMERYPEPADGKNILIISQRTDGYIYGSVATIADGQIKDIIDQQKLTEVITQILETL